MESDISLYFIVSTLETKYVFVFYIDNFLNTFPLNYDNVSLGHDYPTDILLAYWFPLRVLNSLFILAVIPSGTCGNKHATFTVQFVWKLTYFPANLSLCSQYRKSNGCSKFLTSTYLSHSDHSPFTSEKLLHWAISISNYKYLKVYFQFLKEKLMH